MSATILAVDDIPDNLRVIAGFLLQAGYDVRPVTNGREALRLAADDPPDLVLLDIRMPEMDGFAVCAGLKANPLTAEIPIVFLSASGDLGDKLKAFEVGGADYIEKPFQEREVLARVELQLHLRRAQRELAEARDALEVKVIERTRELAQLAYFDTLTGLPNRKKFREEIDRLIDDRAVSSFGLLLLDLDRFKEINDALGHSVGDEMLRLTAVRLTQIVDGHPAFVARLGGDEFAFCIEGADLAESEMWAERVLGTLDAPFQLDGMRIEMGGSVGIATFPQDGDRGGELLRCSDVAMYIAKRTLSGYACYSPRSDFNSYTRLALVSEFLDAIEYGHLILHYQPKIRIDSGKLTGVEALVRWQHPRYGLLPPGEFLPQIELTDMIRRLSHWVIEAAAIQITSWLKQGLRIVVAVNLSARNLVEVDLPDLIGRILARHGVPPELLEVEITETAMMVDPERSLAVLERIAALRVGLAVDDFGTGYSSFGLLRRLPRSMALKIDRSFIARALNDPADGAIVASMVHLVNGLNARAIAEGVEDEATLSLLAKLGCHEAQGFLIARPMPEQVFRQWLIDRPAGTS